MGNNYITTDGSYWGYIDSTVLIVSHDFDYVRKFADKVIMIDKSVVAEGTPDEVFASKIFKDTFGDI